MVKDLIGLEIVNVFLFDEVIVVVEVMSMIYGLCKIKVEVFFVDFGCYFQNIEVVKIRV